MDKQREQFFQEKDLVS